MGTSTSPQVTAGLQQRATDILAGKRFISELAVEGAYGIPRKTLRNWRVLGLGPRYRKFNAAVRYDVRDIEAWIETLPAGGEGVPSSALKSAIR